MSNERRISEQLGSVCFLLDSDFVIRECTDTLLRYMPELAEGEHRLTDVFDIQRPRNLKDFAAALKTSGAMVLMSASHSAFAVRGQFILVDGAQDHVRFVGAPWLSWMNQNHPDLRLQLKDFKAVDPQLDQMILLSTEQRNLEDLNRLNQELREARDAESQARSAQADFFAAMSHEMRTPLNGVTSSLELLEDEGLTPQAAEMIDIARRAADNLRNVVNHVLDFSRLQAGGFELIEGQYDLGRMVKVALQIVSASAEKKGLELKREGNFAGFQLMGDESKVQQTAINLLSNAIKFTESGTVTLSANYDAEAGQLELAVKDTGPGIPQEQQADVFRPFWSSAHDNYGDLSRGSGLGLSICAQLVEIMGGEIGLSSAEGLGSRFWFRIPCEEVEGGAELDEDSSVRMQFTGHVLLVDDDPTNQYLSRLLLERRGLRVDSAGDGQEAVDKVLANNFDLVFMDISMPVMNGPEATEVLRKTLDKEALPIIALTAHASDADRQNFLDIGMNDCISKPIVQATLDAVLSRFLEGGAEEPKPAAAEDDEAVGDGFDAEIAENFRNEIGERAWCRVAGIFENDARMKMDRLRDHLAAGTLPQARNDAHSLHSMATSLGCIGYGKALKNLELILQDEQGADLQQVSANRVLRLAPLALDRLAAELARVEKG